MFRLLLERPRPRVRLEHKIRGIDAALYVRALRSLEESSAADEARDVPEELRHAAITAGYVSRSLMVGDAMAFQSADEVGLLSEHEVQELGVHVVEALLLISPSYRRSNVDAWALKLTEGARANLYEASLLADCVGDHGARPEWYFGGLVSDMTDGQHMVFSAAYKVIRQIRDDGKKQTR